MLPFLRSLKILTKIITKAQEEYQFRFSCGVFKFEYGGDCHSRQPQLFRFYSMAAVANLIGEKRAHLQHEHNCSIPREIGNSCRKLGMWLWAFFKVTMISMRCISADSHLTDGNMTPIAFGRHSVRVSSRVVFVLIAPAYDGSYTAIVIYLARQLQFASMQN